MIRGKPLMLWECRYLPILNKVTAGADIPRTVILYRELLQVFGRSYMGFMEY